MRGWDPPSLRLRLFHLPAPSLQTATAAGVAGAAGTALPPCLPQRQQRPPCRIDPCPSLTLPQFQALPICPLGTRNSVRAAPVNTGAVSSHLPYSPPLDLTSPAPASYLIHNDTLLLPHHLLSLTCAFRACTRNRCTSPHRHQHQQSAAAPASSPLLPLCHHRYRQPMSVC